MSKYSRPALTSRLKKRSRRAAFLTLVMASMTASLVCVMPSLAQEPRSNDQSQQKPAGESQNPAPARHGYQWERKIQQTPVGESQRQAPVRDGSNWDRRIPQKPAGESQSSATVRDGSNWEQQPPSESQNSDASQDTQDVSLNADPKVELLPLAFSALVAVTPPFTASPGDDRVILITGVPFTRAVSAWITEVDANGNPHIGTAIFRTSSVQLNRDDQGRYEIKVRYRVENVGVPLRAIAMVTY